MAHCRPWYGLGVVISLLVTFVAAAHGASDAFMTSDWVLEMADINFRRTCSQGVQDHVLHYIFSFIEPTNRYYVEFGFDGNSYEESLGANTCLLRRRGWRGLLLDGGHENKDINLHKSMITPRNIVGLFEQHHVPRHFDYLSVDMDSADCFVLQAILAGGYAPRVVTIEYNCHFSINSTVSFPDDPSERWEADRMYGCSLGAIHALARRFSYTLVHVVSQLDAFLVQDALLVGVKVPDLSAFVKKTSLVLHAPVHRRERLAKLVDFKCLLDTSDAPTCTRKAAEQLAAEPDALVMRTHD